MDVRRWVAAAACAPLLALAGCSDDEPQAKPQDPTASAAPSPTATATDSAPTIPPEAQGTDEASAAAFAGHFFSVLSVAMKTGDTSGVSDLSGPRCQTCSSVSERIKNIYSKGGTLRTNGWTVEESIPEEISAPKRAFVLRVRQSRSALLDENGDVVSREAAVRTPMRIEVAPRAGSWRVTRLDVVS